MKVAIVGGTHGNEKTGIFLIRKFLENPSLLPAEHQYKLLIGNPKATESHQRYLDFDLNRAFHSKVILPTDYEFTRAQTLQKEVESWSQDSPFFLVDLHTTTSNMGPSIVLSKKDLFSAHVADLVLKQNPETRLVFNTRSESKGHCFVESMAPHALLIEVGPVSQNTFNPKAIESTETLLKQILGAIDKVSHQNHLPPITLSGYQEGGSEPFPKDSKGLVAACIHPQFQGRDFQVLKPGDPLFLHRDGQTIAYDGKKELHPIFIGEAAYLEAGAAYTRAWKAEETFTDSSSGS